MKKEKLIKSIKNIDDDLICEAMNRRSEETPPIEEKAEIISVSGGKRRSGQLWKYPVTAAALLGVIGGAVFVANNRGAIDNIDATVSGEPSESIADTVNPEISENVSKTVEEAISTIVTKEPKHIVPIKTKELITAGCIFYVESFPDIPKTPFGKECFTEMSSDELFKYYGIEDVIDNLVSYMSHNNKAHGRDYLEVIDNNPYGIYTSPDGDTFDVNSFHFSNPNFGQNDLTITVGKKIKFGQEYYIERIPEGQKYHLWSLFYYNKDKDILFAVYEYNGCSVMITSIPEDYENILGNYDNFSIEEEEES